MACLDRRVLERHHTRLPTSFRSDLDHLLALLPADGGHDEALVAAVLVHDDVLEELHFQPPEGDENDGAYQDAAAGL